MDSISCFRHPHHVSLIDTQSFRSRLAHVGDPYYNIDHLHSHQGLSAPKFDILESENAYFLVGELPGLTTKDGISFEWLDDQILFLHGRVDPGEIENHFKNLAPSKVEGKAKMKTIHCERHFGPFERSFTLPMKVNSSSLEMSLDNGLLKIMVQK